MSQQLTHEELKALPMDTSCELDMVVKESPTEKESENFFSIFDFPLFQWKAFFLFTGCCLGIIFHWLLTSEIFDPPTDVIVSRNEFFLAKDRYEKNQPYWDAKYAHFISAVRKEISKNESTEVLLEIQQVSSEILLAFLIKELNVRLDRLNQLCIYPKGENSSFSLIISKYEQGIWPLKILLSLEIEIKVKDGHFSLEFTRLRRGSQDISLGLSWAYFGPELDPLKRFDLFSLPIFAMP
ncbi:MAG: hypothetical protein JWO53_615, partial [Chlamydiia bacterium]|nr:hypothetical protein [Chlamydiia bacterium]